MANHVYTKNIVHYKNKSLCDSNTNNTEKALPMLTSRPRAPANHLEIASVHNYYERLVIEAIMHTNERATSDSDFMADVSCVALNHLPPRYIRHDVDMSFFMSPTEREETADKVQQAVDHAIEFVLAHEQEKSEQDTVNIQVEATPSSNTKAPETPTSDSSTH